MTATASLGTLMFLGRRIERLLYVGALLTALAFAGLYLAYATAELRDRAENQVNALIEKIEAQRPELAALYLISKRPPPVDTSKDPGISATRRKLGLPPASKKIEPDVGITYRSALSDIGRIDSRDPVASAVLSPDKSPEEIVYLLREMLEKAERSPIKVWDTEAPRELSFQYFGSSTRVPIDITAQVLATVMGPVVILWIGAFRITRQRELILIKTLTDWKSTFPHVLNLLSVYHEQFETDFSRRKVSVVKSFNRIWLSLMRTGLLAVFVCPIVIATAMSWYYLLPAWEKISIYNWLFGGIIVVVGVLELLSMFLQEWLFLGGKQFYESP